MEVSASNLQLNAQVAVVPYGFLRDHSFTFSAFYQKYIVCDMDTQYTFDYQILGVAERAAVLASTWLSSDNLAD